MLGQEQQVIKANSPSMAGWHKQAIEQMCEQILHIKKRSKEGGLKTITWLTRFKGHLNIMCNVWTNINIAYFQILQWNVHVLGYAMYDDA